MTGYAIRNNKTKKFLDDGHGTIIFRTYPGAVFYFKMKYPYFQKLYEVIPVSVLEIIKPEDGLVIDE